MKWKASLGILLVFLLGGLAGSLGASLYFTHRATLLFQRGPVALVDLMERRMTRHLNLDAAQKEKVHQYFMQNLQERMRLQAQIQPQVRMLNQQTLQQINSLLKPEQATLLRRNLEESRRRFGRPFLNGTEESTPASSLPPAENSNSSGN